MFAAPVTSMFANGQPISGIVYDMNNAVENMGQQNGQQPQPDQFPQNLISAVQFTGAADMAGGQYALIEQPSKSGSKKWKEREKEQFYDVLRDNIDSSPEQCIAAIAERLDSRSTSEVSAYYYKVIRMINKILGPTTTLQMDDHLNVHKAMLKYRDQFNSIQPTDLTLKKRRTQSKDSNSNKRAKSMSELPQYVSDQQQQDNDDGGNGGSLGTGDPMSMKQASKENGKYANKIHLQFYPMTATVAQAMREQGYAEVLDLHVGKGKSLSSVLKYLHRKWSKIIPGGGGVESITLTAPEDGLLPGKVWGASEADNNGGKAIEASELHQALGCPSPCKLLYNFITPPAPSAMSHPCVPPPHPQQHQPESSFGGLLGLHGNNGAAVMPPPPLPIASLGVVNQHQHLNTASAPMMMKQNKSFLQMLQEDTEDGFGNMNWQQFDYGGGDDNNDYYPDAELESSLLVAPIAAATNDAGNGDEKKKDVESDITAITTAPSPPAIAKKLPVIRRALWSNRTKAPPPPKTVQQQRQRQQQSKKSPGKSTAAVVKSTTNGKSPSGNKKKAHVAVVVAEKKVDDGDSKESKELMPPPKAKPTPAQQQPTTTKTDTASLYQAAIDMPLPPGMLQYMAPQIVPPTTTNTTAPQPPPKQQQQQNSTKSNNKSKSSSPAATKTKDKTISKKSPKKNNKSKGSKSTTSSGDSKQHSNKKKTTATKAKKQTATTIANNDTAATVKPNESSNVNWLAFQCPSPPSNFQLPSDFQQQSTPGEVQPRGGTGRKKSRVPKQKASTTTTTGKDVDMVKGIDALFKDMFTGTDGKSSGPSATRTAINSESVPGSSSLLPPPPTQTVNFLMKDEPSKLSLLDGFPDLNSLMGVADKDKDTTWLGAFEKGQQQQQQKAASGVAVERPFAMLFGGNNGGKK